jgi:hypothetical protein
MSVAMADELRQLGRVHINNGRTFEARDSLEFLVSNVALVLPVHDPHDPDKDYPVCLEVDQVVRIELIEPSSANGCSP